MFCKIVHMNKEDIQLASEKVNPFILNIEDVQHSRSSQSLVTVLERVKKQTQAAS